MSADNFYVICKHPQGGFAAVMGFASDENFDPVATMERDTCEKFDTADAAFDWACNEYSEYGVSYSPELLGEALADSTTFTDVIDILQGFRHDVHPHPHKDDMWMTHQNDMLDGLIAEFEERQKP